MLTDAVLFVVLLAGSLAAGAHAFLALLALLIGKGTLIKQLYRVVLIPGLVLLIHAGWVVHWGGG